MFVKKKLIKSLTFDEYYDFIKIHKNIFDYTDIPYSCYNGFQAKYSNSFDIIYLLYDNNILIGILIIETNTETNKYFLSNFGIDKSYSRKKLGNYLLNNVLNDLEKSIDCIELNVNSDNEIAIKLYNKYNFKEINNSNNNIIMKKLFD